VALTGGEKQVLSVEWIKCGDSGEWCSLNTVNLDHQHFVGLDGVYVIFGRNGRVIRVGQGRIKDRLAAHRIDREIQAYTDGGLLVTWAKVAAGNLDGVERFLAIKLKPLIGARFPDVLPREVNLPT
jgi:hypothetical protein